MHVRFSSCIGLPIVEDGDHYVLGFLSGILIHPDTGKIEGFLVHAEGVAGQHNLFCGSRDILRWGTRIYVRSADVLAPVEDRIRLQPLLDDPRTVLDQHIQTESGGKLGKCKDVQFNTDSMHIEWLFPKKWFRWGVALPVSEIVEVRNDAIIVRDTLKKESVRHKSQNTENATLPEMEAGMARKS